MPTYHTELVLAHSARSEAQAKRQAMQFMEVAMEKLGVTGVTVERTKVTAKPGGNPQQRKAAKIGTHNRVYRARLKRAIHELGRPDGFEQAALILEGELPPELRTMPVTDFLAACKRVSARSAYRMLEGASEFPQPHGKTLGELSSRQRESLARRLRERA